MNKLKRIFALSGAVLLVCMYVSTLVFALSGSPAAPGLFKASVAATILIPVLLYAFILVARLLNDRSVHNGRTDNIDSSGDTSDV